MLVSLNKSLESVSSTKYNKQNILVFIIFMLIIYLISSYFDIKNPQPLSQQLAYFYNSMKTNSVVSFLSVFTCVISTGFYIVTTNNEVNKKDDVFPSYSDYKSIIIKGIEYYLGMLILFLGSSFVLTLIEIIFFLILAIILGITGASSNIILIFSAIAFCIVFLITYMYLIFRFFIPQLLIYKTTLEFSDIFSFKKVKRFMEERNSYYPSYLISWILLGLITLTIVVILAIIFSISGVLAVSTEKISNNAIQIVITTLCGVIISSILNIYGPKLNEQIINSAPTDWLFEK